MASRADWSTSVLAAAFGGGAAWTSTTRPLPLFALPSVAAGAASGTADLAAASVAGLPWPCDISACWIAAKSSGVTARSEEHTSELQSLMRISYAVFCLQKKNTLNQ